MLRLSQSAKKKGQWFLVSAVVISGAFLLISTLFKDYLVLDQSAVARMNEDYYFNNIKEQLSKIVNTYGYSDCNNLNEKLDEFMFFSGERMAERGYYLYVESNVNCAQQTATFGVLLASDRMVIYENVNPDDILS